MAAALPKSHHIASRPFNYATHVHLRYYMTLDIVTGFPDTMSKGCNLSLQS